MRIFAPLLGVFLTAGSVYVAQLAVESAGYERLVARAPRGGDLGSAGELWYGGVLAPVTVEATRAARPWVSSSQLAMSQKATECAHLARPKGHALVMGSMM